jgi:imidazole glycerol-phosphate synthase subunit HisH
MSNVVVIDLGMSNTDSVLRAIEECGGSVTLSNRVEDFEAATHIILPGVGTFQEGMKNIRKLDILETIEEQVFKHKIPFLGICLGMQLLSKNGLEYGDFEGLGWIEGTVDRFKKTKKNERIPHVGWNEVNLVKPSPILDGIESGKDFYFVHSFYFKCEKEENKVATTPYCGEFTSVVQKDNVFGTQFHPEKSQKIGFAVLRNFLSL